MKVNTPKRRFKGFSEDWKQCKFEKLLDYDDGIRRGPFGSALKKEYFVQNSDYVVYEQNNAISNHFKTRYKITEEKFKELHKFELLPGDFIMSGAGTIGRVSLVPPNISRGVINQALIRIRLNETTDSGYFLEWIMSPKMQRKLTESNPGSAMVNLVPMRELKNWKVRIPTVKEQIKISRLLNTLQKTISLHKRKFEKIKQLQKSYLNESIFSEPKCVPKRRFKGFSEDWKQEKLKNVVERVTRKNNGKTDFPLTISAQDGLVDQRHYFKRQVASKNMDNYILIKKGEYAYNKSYSKDYPFGAIKMLKKYDYGALSTLYIVFKATNISPRFLESYYESHYWHKEINKIAAEGARNHGLLNLSTQDFFKTNIKIPSTSDEQLKISNIVNQLDSLITLHKHKHNAIKTLQKIYLQNNLKDETYA